MNDPIADAQARNNPNNGRSETPKPNNGGAITLGTISLLLATVSIILNFFSTILSGKLISGVLHTELFPEIGLEVPSLTTNSLLLLIFSLLVMIASSIFASVIKRKSSVKPLLGFAKAMRFISSLGFGIACLVFIASICVLNIEQFKQWLFDNYQGSIFDTYFSNL